MGPALADTPKNAAIWELVNCCRNCGWKMKSPSTTRQHRQPLPQLQGIFSVVLLALVDANYKFIWCDVGGLGTMSDCQIFNESELKQCLDDDSINFPAPEPLPHDDRETPLFLLGDDAFALRTYMMKPYSSRALTYEQRICNYRISRGRRVMENAFGILAMRFQVLLSINDPAVAWINMPERCLRHVPVSTMWCAMETQAYTERCTWQRRWQPRPHPWRMATGGKHAWSRKIVAPNRDTRAGKQQREYLRLYFNSAAGSVPWQDRMI